MTLDTCGAKSSVARWVGSGLFLTGYAAAGMNLNQTIPYKGAQSAVTAGHIVSWGTVSVTAAGGGYRLCWCAGGIPAGAQFPDTPRHSPMFCSIPEGFRTDIGRLSLIGVFPLEQDRTCVAGQTCRLDGISGQYLSPSNAFALLDTCGLATVSRNAVGKGFPQAMEASGAAVRWTAADTALTVAGGEYRLCWCEGANFICSTGGDFRTDVGELTLVGPSPLDQDRTCVSGNRCRIDGLVGQDLSLADAFLVVDTCRRASSVPRYPKSGTALSLTRSGEVAAWGTAHVTAAGGQYRICWCAGSSSNLVALVCSHTDHFQVDLGSLTLVGPLPLYQGRTCVSGQSCQIDGIGGQHLSVLDQFLVLDTCGLLSAGVPPRFAGYGSDLKTVIPIQSPAFPKSSSYGVMRFTGSGSTVNWGRAALGPETANATNHAHFVTSAGGAYRLCWCGGIPVAHRQGDVWRPTRPYVDYVGGRPHPFPPNVTYNTTSINFTGAQMSVLVGSSICSVSDNFETDVGELTMIGPAPLSQDRTCVSGHTCEMDGIAGQHLSEWDRLQVLDTCGMGTALSRFADGGLFDARLALSGRNATLDMTVPNGQLVPGLQATGSVVAWKVSTAAGGEYRLCWCAGSPSRYSVEHYLGYNESVGNSSRRATLRCSNAVHFRTNFGKFMLMGVSPLSQGRTCVSGRSCSFGGILGSSVSSMDQIMILDTCAYESSPPRWAGSGTHVQTARTGAAVSWGMFAASTAGGEYRLCWCAGIHRIVVGFKGAMFCSTAENFRVDMGALTVIGPAPLSQHRTCVSGQTCELDGITGHHLFHRDRYRDLNTQDERDLFLVLDTCGKSSMVLRFPNRGLVETTIASGAVTNFGSAFLTTKGGEYRLCWCSGEAIVSWSDNFALGHENATRYRCSLAEEFRTDIGQFSIVGPRPLFQHRTCLSGNTCQLDGITGQYLSESDELMVLDTCGGGKHVAAPPRLTTAGLSSPQVNNAGLLVDARSTGAIFLWTSLPLSAAGGEYRLCWCAGSAPFARNLTLQYRQPRNRSHTHQPSGGQEYQPLDVFCSATDHFRTDTGELTVVGPAPLSQDRTCLSGQICRIAGIMGQDLTSADHVVALHTCAAPSYIERFPSAGYFSDFMASGSIVSWGTVHVSAGGGEYRLCWCAGSLLCSLVQHFKVDIGELSLIGVVPLLQSRTCVSGQTCKVDGISGQDLSVDDQGMVLDTCAQDAVLTRFPDFGRVFGTSGSGAVLSWDGRSRAPVSAAGGLYRMCWCGAAYSRCSTPENFRVDIGQLVLIGVSPLHHNRTCVSGQICKLDGISGTHLSEDDRFMVMDTCGVDLAGVPRWPGAGRFDVVGSALGPSVLRSSDGRANSRLNRTKSEFTIATLSWGDIESTSQGGQYRICWCADLGQIILSHNESRNVNNTKEVWPFSECLKGGQFRVDFGELSFLGVAPLAQDRTCVSGQSCSVDGIRGMHLDVQDRFLVLDSCGQIGQYRDDPGSTLQVSHNRTDAVHRGNASDTKFAVIPRFAAFGYSQTVSGGGLVLGAHEYTFHGNRSRTVSIVALRVSWGTSHVTSAGGQYRLCWCAGVPTSTNATMPHASFRCSVAENFRTDAGQLTLLGPSPLWQARTCVSGQTCKYDGIIGQNLKIGDHMVVLDTCAAQSYLPRFVNAGTFIELLASGGVVSWGSVHVTCQGGEYRLCWCSSAGSFACSLAEHFRTDTGELTVISTAPLHQDRTCVSGQTCTTDGILGHYLVGDDLFAVLDTCGVPSALPRFATFGMVDQVSSSGALVSWGYGNALLQRNLTEKIGGPGGGAPFGELDAITAAGGKYRLCWCARSWFICSAFTSFRTDAGQFTLIGVAPLAQGRTCVSGQSCKVDGIMGQDLTVNDLFGVLDTCGNPYRSNVPRFVGAGRINGNLASGAIIRWGEVASGSVVAVTAEGGEYRLCWCADRNLVSCDIPEFFRVEAGEFTLIGPAPLFQHRTCVSGQTCTVDGLLGQDLQISDQFIVLDTCGRSTTVISRLPLSGALFAVTSTGAVASWGTGSPITAAGGEYRFCWCGGADPQLNGTNAALFCSGSDHFRVDLGKITLIGPSPLSQDRTCVSGQVCKLDGMLGQHLGSLDIFQVLDTCGASVMVPRFAEAGRIAENSCSGAVVTWGKLATRYQTEVTAEGGQYRLCWCAFDCGGQTRLRVDVGTVVIIGPRPLEQDRTCISGQTCKFDGFTGEHLQHRDSFLLMDTCGEHRSAAVGSVASVSPKLPVFGQNWETLGSGATAGWGSTPVSAPGGEYRLCWCVSPTDVSVKGNEYGFHMLRHNETVGFICSVAENFRVDMGALTLIGPSPLVQHRTCVAGQTCSFNGITSQHASFLDRVAVLETCGGGAWADALPGVGQTLRMAPVLPRFPFFGQLISLTAWSGLGGFDASGSGAMVSWGSVESTAAGGEYRLCWCSHARLVNTLPLYNETMASWFNGTQQRGHFVCDNADEFRTDFGELTFIGPSPLSQDRTCVSGQTCKFDKIRGQKLAQTDALLLLDTCVVDREDRGVLPRFSSQGRLLEMVASGAVVSWGTVEATAAGGKYRMCWCAGANFLCSVAGHFRVDMARLLLIGPSPLVQDRTCVSGQTCKFDGIAGQNLCSVDSVAALDTCGEQAMIPRWPNGAVRVAVAPPQQAGEVTRGTGAIMSWGSAVTSSAGGLYRLCWCSSRRVQTGDWFYNRTANRLNDTWYHGNFVCENMFDFNVDIGRFTVIGVSPISQHRTCVSGQTCQVDGLLGQHLSFSDQFLVFDTCGSSAGVPRIQPTRLIVDVMASGAVASWGTVVALTAAGGEYRLCWCAGVNFLCSVADNFRVDIGEFTLIGPAPLSQDRTCVSGQLCKIDGIFGQDISSLDQLVVLDSCSGRGASPRFPDTGVALLATQTLTWDKLSRGGRLHRQLGKYCGHDSWW